MDVNSNYCSLKPFAVENDSGYVTFNNVDTHCEGEWIIQISRMPVLPNCPTVINLWPAANVQIKCMWQTIVSPLQDLSSPSLLCTPLNSTLECVLPQVFKIVLVSAGLHPFRAHLYTHRHPIGHPPTHRMAGSVWQQVIKVQSHVSHVVVGLGFWFGGVVEVLNLLYIWIFPSLARNSSVGATKWISSRRLASFFNSFNLAACEVETFQDQSKQTVLCWARTPSTIPYRTKSIVGIRVFVQIIERKLIKSFDMSCDIMSFIHTSFYILIVINKVSTTESDRFINFNK